LDLKLQTGSETNSGNKVGSSAAYQSGLPTKTTAHTSQGKGATTNGVSSGINSTNGGTTAQGGRTDTSIKDGKK